MARVKGSEACPDDAIAPATPSVTSRAFWSVEFSAAWTAASSVTITWSPVDDDCLPLEYAIEIESCALWTHEWTREWLLGSKHLSATSHQFDWAANTWGRYRLWSTDANGQSSASTGWRYFVFAGPDAPSQDHFKDPPS